MAVYRGIVFFLFWLKSIVYGYSLGPCPVDRRKCWQRIALNKKQKTKRDEINLKQKRQRTLPKTRHSLERDKEAFQ